MKALIGASIQPARPLCASPGVRVVPSPEMPSPRSSCAMPRFIFSLMAHSSSERSTSKARVWWNPVNEAEAERVGRRKEPGRAAKRNFDRGAAAGSGAGRRRGAGLGRIRPERRQELALVPLDNPAGRNIAEGSLVGCYPSCQKIFYPHKCCAGVPLCRRIDYNRSDGCSARSLRAVRSGSAS